MSRPRRPFGPTAADAHRAVGCAIFDGLLARHPAACELCGASGAFSAGGQWSVQWHHHSVEVEFHLDVVALCRGCHGHVHHGHIPEPLTGEIRTDFRGHQRVQPFTSEERASLVELSRRALAMARARRRVAA